MKLYLCFGLAICLVGSMAAAKPLINSSEESLASICIGYDDTAERLIEICTLALDMPGATSDQRLDMQEALGYAYYDEDRLDKAEEVFMSLKTLSAHDVRALKGLGWVAHEREDFATARDYFKRSNDVNPTGPGMAGLADSLWELGEATSDEVLTYYDAALALAPDYYWALRQKGWVLLDVDRDEEARSLFADIVNEHPDDTNARAGLLRAHKALENSDAALEEANRVLVDYPDYYWFLSERSDLMRGLGRYRQAIRDAERLIEIDPDEGEGYVLKARPMAELGQRQAALALLAQAEQKTGPDPYLIYWWASMLVDDNQLYQGRKQIQRNTGRDTADVYDFALLGLIDLLRDDYSEARYALDQALDLDPDEPYAIYYEAMLILHQDKAVAQSLDRFDDAMRAGLPDSHIGDFAAELIDAGFMMHAIAIRAKYVN